MRALIVFFLLLPAGPLLACSCSGFHVPLEDVLCNFDTTGGFVVELVYEGFRDEGRIFDFRTERVLRGSYPESQLIMDRVWHSCYNALLSDLRPGDHVVFFGDRYLDGPEGYFTYECLWSSNLYRMRRDGSAFEYSFPSDDGFNVGLRYRPVGDLLGMGCGEGVFPPSTLDEATLYGNNGGGELRLLGPDRGVLTTDDLQLYAADGRVIPLPATATETPGGGVIRLPDLPAGVYYLAVRAGEERRSWAVLLR